MIVFVDTSALGSAYLGDEDSAMWIGEVIFDGPDPVVVCELADVELASLLVRARGDHRIDESGLFPIGLKAILIGGDALESEGINSGHCRIPLLKGTLINQRGYPLDGPHAEMIIAFRTDSEILLDGKMMHHLRATRTLRPEPLRHLPFLVGKLEGRFLENRHGG